MSQPYEDPSNPLRSRHELSRGARLRAGLGGVGAVAALLAAGCGRAEVVDDAGQADEAAEVAAPLAQRREIESRRAYDPATDGWESETVAGQAGSILKHVGAALASGDYEKEGLAHYTSPALRVARLRPAQLVTPYADGTFEVRRAETGGELREIALAEALEELRTASGAPEELRAKLKVVEIQLDDESVTTTVLYQDKVVLASGVVQRTATWDVRWKRPPSGEDLQLASIGVRDYEEVSYASSGATLFADCTLAVFGEQPAFRDQLRYGAEYWASRLEGYFSRTLVEAHMGVALGDVNADGLEDLYVCQPTGLPNRLFVQRPDGTLRDVSAEAGVDILEGSSSALIVDLDNDGDQDLAVLAGRRSFVFANDGSGRFEKRAQHGGGFGYSLTAADFDLDGDLDLYRCAYRPTGDDGGAAQFEQPVPLFNATNGGRNMLLRNDGELVFSDVTEASGMDHNNDRWSYAAAWEDFDLDGDPDLYVANDFGHNNLYLNEGGRFTDVASKLGAIDANFGMSVTWGDPDRDGRMDLYVSNMFSSAGNRVVPQAGFQAELGGDKDPFLRLARGNTLLSNRASEHSTGVAFVDESVEANTTMGRWSWGSLFVDLNNDGWEDLLVTNGYLTREKSDDL